MSIAGDYLVLWHIKGDSPSTFGVTKLMNVSTDEAASRQAQQLIEDEHETGFGPRRDQFTLVKVVKKLQPR